MSEAADKPVGGLDGEDCAWFEETLYTVVDWHGHYRSAEEAGEAWDAMIESVRQEAKVEILRRVAPEFNHSRNSPSICNRLHEIADFIEEGWWL